MNTQLEIAKICDSIKDLLLQKNARYGDSALNPCRIFSKADAVEQILVRIDDKLSRIQRGAGLVASDEDVINDLIGYLILLKIALMDKPKNLSVYRDLMENLEKWNGIDIEPEFKFRNNQDDMIPSIDVASDYLSMLRTGSPD